ncbi:MAG: hypothetical protein U0002_18145 [Thermoanaerobaculia bacterium]
MAGQVQHGRSLPPREQPLEQGSVALVRQPEPPSAGLEQRLHGRKQAVLLLLPEEVLPGEAAGAHLGRDLLVFDRVGREAQYFQAVGRAGERRALSRLQSLARSEQAPHQLHGAAAHGQLVTRQGEQLPGLVQGREMGAAHFEHQQPAAGECQGLRQGRGKRRRQPAGGEAGCGLALGRRGQAQEQLQPVRLGAGFG